MAKKVSKTDDQRFEILKQLTEEQKDKLLLKLFRKDPLLVEKLAFEFLETATDLPTRRKEIEAKIDYQISKQVVYWDTPGELMMEMRNVNGRITEHVKITKDKFGEVALTVRLLNTAFIRFWDMLNEKQGRADTFSVYVLKRTEAIIPKADKLSIEEKIELQPQIVRLLSWIKRYPKTQNQMDAYKIPQ